MVFNAYTLRQRQFELLIGDLDISDAVVQGNLTREQLSFESPPFIRGSFTLAAHILAQSLNPRNSNIWKPYARISLRIPDDAATLTDPPFGRYLRVQNLNYQSSYGPFNSPIQEETLTLEVVDILAYSQEPELPETIGDIIYPAGSTVLDLINLYLNSRGLPSVMILPGDEVPSFITERGFTFPAQGETTVEHCHKILWGQADASYYLYVDNQERIRLGKATIAPMAIAHSFTPEQFPTFTQLSLEKEQIPGALIATSQLTRITTPRPTPAPVFTQVTEISNAVISQTLQETFYSINVTGPFTLDRTTNWGRRGAVLTDEPVTNTTLIISEVSETLTQYGGADNRLISQTTRSFQPVGNVDSSDRANATLTADPAQIEIMTPDYDGEVMRQRKTESRKMRGLLGLSGNQSELVTETVQLDLWQRYDDDEYRYYGRTIDVLNQDRQPLYTAAAPTHYSSQSRPPAKEVAPENFVTKEIELQSVKVFTYGGAITITGNINEKGTGSFSGTIQRFTGTGLFTSSPPGFTWQQTGTLLGPLTGTLEGTGHFQGTGTYTGTTGPVRTRRFDYANYPVSQVALDRLATDEAVLILGRYYAMQIEFPLTLVSTHLEKPGWTIAVNSEVYFCTGDALLLERDRILVGTTGLYLGEWDGSTFTQALTVNPRILTDDAGHSITTEDGIQILI